jgi:putative MATE family efflux protein
VRDLTTGSEARQIVVFTLPMLIGNVFQQLYNTVDSLVVGNLVGKTALAAVGASFPILFLMVSLITGVTMGTTVIVAQNYGSRDFRKVRAAVDTAYIFLFWAGLALTAVGLLSARWLVGILDVPPDAVGQAVTYLQILFAGMTASIGYNTVSAVLRGLGDSRTPLYLLVFSTLLNTVLDLLFVGVFHWGVAGAAWATVISQAVSFGGAIAVLNGRNEFVRLSLKELRFDRESFRHSMRIGLPTGLQQTLVASGMMVLTRIVSSFGTDVLAGFTVASRLDSFAMMPAMNISQALSAFTGQNIGAGKTDRVRRGFRAGLLLGLGISLVTSIAVISAGRELISLFNPDPLVIEAGAQYLLIVGAFYVVFSTMFVVNGVLRGAGEALVPLLNTILALWIVRIPCAMLLSSRAGAAGIWWAMPAGWTAGCAAALIYYASGRWKDRGPARRPCPPEEEEAREWAEKEEK